MFQADDATDYAAAAIMITLALLIRQTPTPPPYAI
jgi:hypothetical protein